MMHVLSTTLAKWGRSSLIHCPLSPRRSKLNCPARILGTPLMKAKRLPSRNEGGRNVRNLAIGAAHHDCLDELFQRPAAIAVFGRQPIQQFGIRGRRALHAEVLLGLDDAGAEQ